MSNIGFVFIPPHIMAIEELTIQEKMVYGRIIGLTESAGYCFATNQWIGKQLGLSASMVSKHISKLVNKGFLYLDIQKIKKDERTGKVGEKYGTIRKIYAYQNGKLDNPYTMDGEPPYTMDGEYSNTDSRKEIYIGGENQLEEKEVELNQEGGSKKESLSSLSSPASQGMSERSEDRGPLPELSSQSQLHSQSESEMSNVPSLELEEYLEKKALNKAKKRIKNQYGGTIPPWVDLEKEAKKEEKPSVTVTQTVPELEEFAQFLKWLKSINRPSTYHPDTEANWKRVRQTFEVAEIKAAVKIALLDDWWKDNFNPHRFFRQKNQAGEPVDHVATFYAKRAGGDYEITKIKQEMAKEMGKK